VLLASARLAQAFLKAVDKVKQLRPQQVQQYWMHLLHLIKQSNK
jgi:hypothetical protein